VEAIFPGDEVPPASAPYVAVNAAITRGRQDVEAALASLTGQP
jgi:hypothetical protein